MRRARLLLVFMLAGSGCSRLLGIEVPPVTDNGGTSDVPDAGSAPDAGITADALTAGSWSSPAQIATMVFSNRLFADSTGNVFLAWISSGPAGMAQRWTARDGWSSARLTPIPFSDLSAGGGSAVGVASIADAVSYHALASVFSTSTGWGAAEQVDAETSQVSVGRVAVGMDGSGNALVAFDVSCAFSQCTVYGIKSRLRTPTGSWGAITPVSSTAGYAYLPHMAMAPSGTAVLSYGQYDSGQSGATSIWAARYTPGVGWAAPQRFPTGETGSSDDSDAAIDASGNGMVVWNGVSAHAIWASRNTGNGWSTPVQINTIAGNVNPPILAMSPAGDAVAVWNVRIGSSSQYALHAVRFSAATGTWGPEREVSASAISPARGSAALDAAGTALIVWEDLDSPVHAWASRMPSGATTWESPVRLDTGIGGDADYRMSAACTPTGTCFGSWTQYDVSPRMGMDRLYLTVRP